MNQAFLDQARLIPLDWSKALGRELNSLAQTYFFSLLRQECHAVLPSEQDEAIEQQLKSGQSFSARTFLEPLAAHQGQNIDSIKNSIYMVAVMAALLTFFEQQYPDAYAKINKDNKGNVILSDEVAAIIFAQGPAPKPIVEQIPSITSMLKSMPSLV